MKFEFPRLPGQPSAADLTLNWRAQQERRTQDVTALMALVIWIAMGVILAGTLAGYFRFLETLPIYLLGALITPAWWGAKRGGWRWAAYFPAGLCFALAVFSSINNGLVSIFVLFYALAVLLAGMLIANRAGLWMAFASALAYAGLGLARDGTSPDSLAYLITFSFGLVGIALLHWYLLSRFQQVLNAQSEANAALSAEITRRKQAEGIQREQEKQIQRLAEHISDLITEIDTEGIIRYASPSYRALLGYAPESLLGTNAFDLLHPNDRQTAREAARKVAVRRAPGRVQVRGRCADGHYLDVEISGDPLFDEQDHLTGYVLTTRDITLQKQAENAIYSSEKKFRALIESLPLGMHMYDLEEDGRLVFSGYNPAANTILGVDHAAFLGKTIEEAFPGLADTVVPARYREVARLGVDWHNELIDYTREPIQGAFEVHAFQTRPGRVAAIFADITERSRAAEALRLSEEKFSTAFLTSPDSVNINRLSDGVYLDINQGFTRLTGYSCDDVLGKSSLELNIWDDPADREQLVRGLLENGVVENFEARFRRKNGDVGVGLMSARVMTVHGEKCILSITRDITERIEAVRALRQSESELREAHARLEQAYDATLQGWARALELRERETADHSRRVVELSLVMARALDIGGEALLHLQRGALLHDIGKMGVPDEILLKPGPLTPAEWTTMRLHTDFARDMLCNIDYLRPCVTIPYLHHEKWDGSGYPLGLKGTDIPLPARIFALVDVYDALTHDRPYRPAWSEDAARGYLVDQSGRHFDPRIVEIFLRETR